MNARAQSVIERARVVADYFVFASSDEAHVRWLSEALAATGVVEAASPDPDALGQRMIALRPSLVFVDFCGGRIDAATRAVQAVRALSPQVPVIAVGKLAEPESAIAALRAGVRDFVDLEGAAQEAVSVTRQVLENVAQMPARHGRLTVLLGARAGVGVSTLAAHLGVLLQRRGARAGRHAALIDLGLPAGDGMLYLDTRSELDFVEAVRNLRRFDETFVHTALARHASGLALTSLSPDLSALRTVSHASAVALLTRLRAFFDQQIVDLGGFSNHDFVAQVAQAADEVWLVCEPAIASVVSAVDLLRELAAAQFDTGRVGVVVTRFDARLGLSAEQIATRLGLPLIATLPSRRVPLTLAANQGKLLLDTAERDPYVRAVDALADRIAPPDEAHAGALDHRDGETALRARLTRFMRSMRSIQLPPKRS
ncbi:MAG TPA: fimbrial protein [Trinickia sp.]|uniref:fimbrial protein n=1 Tax=Trinickia sp. TaxID=2571163 RepID=UPI002C331101|nr:fimbrial protein [Trinickia sp.]HVW51109.1 fimbrial protein [Trinickia sp.]